MFQLREDYELKDNDQLLGKITIYSGLANKYYEDPNIDILEPMATVYILKRLKREQSSYHIIKVFNK